MLVEDLFTKNRTVLGYRSILHEECAQFLLESNGIPLYKALPKTYSDFHKVKVRFKRTENIVSSTFNQAFLKEAPNLSQRAIFAYSTPPSISEDMDMFYIFPIDKYKFLYSREVTNSTSDYKQVIDTILEAFDSIDKATDIVTDLLKYTYSSTHLHEGLMAKSEVILYGVPFYYALRANIQPNYSHIL